MTIGFWLLLAGLVGATALAVVASALIGNRVAALQDAPRIARMVVVLSILTLAAAVIALALGGPGPDTECSGPLRDGIAAFIAVFAIPSMVIAFAVALAAMFVRRSLRLAVIALATTVAAVLVDWFALTSSLHICLS